MTNNNLPDTDDSSNDVQTAQDFTPTEAASANQIETNDLELEEDNPLANVAGTTGTIEREIHSASIHKRLADDIYSDDSAFFREFAQNSETALIRAAKLRVGEADNDLDVAEARLSDIIETARQLGYDPTIEVDVYHEERKIVWRDNGIGMAVQEAIDAYNTTGVGMAGNDAKTGGVMGMGALTFVQIAGVNTEMLVTTGTRRPDVSGENAKPFAFAATLGGMDPLPNDVRDDFRGFKAEIPVKADVDMSDFSDWVAKYTKLLRVPLLYKEHRGGEVVYDDEFGDTTLAERHNDPKIQLERKGEFSVVAGPDVRSGRGYDDTFLVSMPIDRNSSGVVDGVYNEVIQIHDEQGLIIDGPHEGQYRHEVDSLADDDVVLPQPTTDRDRLQSDSETRNFFEYVDDQLERKEFELVSDYAEQLANADDITQVIADGSASDFELLRNILQHRSGRYSVTSRPGRLKRELNEREELPDFSDEQAQALCDCYETIRGWSWEKGYDIKTKRRGFSSSYLGKVLAKYKPEQVYMVVSTGSTAYKQKIRIVENTHDQHLIVKFKDGSDYCVGEKHGFRKLRNVPLPPTNDDHDYDIPDRVLKKRKQQKEREKKKKQNSGKPDDVMEQKLSLRYDYSAKSNVDSKLKVKDLIERCEDGNIPGRYNSNDELVLFDYGGERSVSNNYWVQKYETMAVATKDQQAVLLPKDNIVHVDDWIERSQNGVVATEDGAMTVRELCEDDRRVLIAYASKDRHKQILSDVPVKKRLRSYLKQDYIEQNRWSGGEPTEDEILLGVADQKTFSLIDVAIKLNNTYSEMRVLRITRARPDTVASLGNTRLDNSLREYKRKARTPDWDDSSNVYNLFESKTLEEILFGFHDAGINPCETEKDLHSMVAGIED